MRNDGRHVDERWSSSLKATSRLPQLIGERAPGQHAGHMRNRKPIATTGEHEDIRELTRDFYSRFYHVTPSGAGIDRVLEGSGQ
jgi:hypothetical protein